MKPFLLPIFFSAAILLPTLHAETTSLPPLPPGPLIAKFAPDFAQWTLTEVPARSSKPAGTATASSSAATAAATTTTPSHPLRRVTVIKTKNIRHVITEESDGQVLEMWAQGRLEVFFRSDWKQPVISDGAIRDDAFYTDISRTDFPGFEWISVKNFTGMRKIEGRDCLIFEDKTRVTDANPEFDSDGAPLPLVALWAAVDLQTRLPTKLVREGVTITYQFAEPPSTALTLPPAVKAVIEAREQRRKQLATPPPSS